ncbi:MAG TPA: hypothetical protein VMT05_05230 [Terriglobales bacterium]|nr:hypothetical protein [Terriglobales bacterium]
MAGGKQRRLIHHVGQISTGKARRFLGDLVEVNIGRQRLAASMDLEDGISPFKVGSIYDHLPVEAARTQQGAAKVSGKILLGRIAAAGCGGE